MGYAYQKVTRVSRTHRTDNNKPKSTGQRTASKRNANAKTRRATRRV